MTFEYRICTTNDEFNAVKALEMLIWQMPPDEAITTHMMHILNHIGGIVLGIFDAERIIGLAVATPTKQSGQLWSHMAGVHPDYQAQGIGYQIKQFQREWALEQGYTEIRWTFDPAMRRNAHFNFHLLGAISNIYRENFYGEMSDGINAGVPSDRFEATWQLESQSQKTEIPDQMAFLLRSDYQQPIVMNNPTEIYHAVACPYDFPALKAQNLALAVEWRYQMREILQTAFEAGYSVVDFVTNGDEKSCYYVLCANIEA